MKTHTPGYLRAEARHELQAASARRDADKTDPQWLGQVAADGRARHWLAQRHGGLDMVAVDFPDADGGLDASPVLLAGPLLEHIREVEARGFTPKPVLPGPLTLLWMSRPSGVADRDDTALRQLPGLVESLRRLLEQIEARAVAWVQIDEPILAGDLPAQWLEAFEATYRRLACPHLKVLLAVCSGSVAKAVPAIARWPVAGLHVDLVGAPEQAEAVLTHWPVGKVLSAGIVDGRLDRRSDLSAALGLLRPLHDRWGDRLWLAPNVGLHDGIPAADAAPSPEAEMRRGRVTAAERLQELAVLKRGLVDGANAVRAALDDSDRVSRAGQAGGPSQGLDLVASGACVTRPIRVNPAF